MLQSIDLDRVSAEAQQIRIGQAILTLLIGFFWLLGWLAGRSVLGFKTAIAAMKVGWRVGLMPSPRRRIGAA